MDWDVEEWLFVLVVVFVAGAPWLLALTSPSNEERAREIYERQHPCISGVRYIVREQGITPMIDPTTMQPQLCGAEKGER
ncbi:MAG: hypothetical protein IPK64_20000 [bacterium]|nr:hypothetical protein [bacterium]